MSRQLRSLQPRYLGPFPRLNSAPIFGIVQLNTSTNGMLNYERQPQTRRRRCGPHQRGATGGAITRAAAAVAAGVAVGVMTRDVGLGVTTAAAAVSILREMLARPGR